MRLSPRGLPPLVCIAPILALVIAACQDDSHGSAESGDGIGVDTIAAWVLLEDLRIGSVESADSGFTRIQSIAEDDRGNVYALNSLEHRVQVFSSQGRFLRAIGRRGIGPGEFQQPVSIGIAGDTLYVVDIDPRRISLFSLDGEFSRQVPTHGVSFRGDNADSPVTLYPRYLRRDGLFESAIRIQPMRSYPDSLRLPELLFDRLGEVVDTAGWRPYYPDTWPSVPLAGGGSVILSNIPDRGRPLYIRDGSRRITIDRYPATSSARGEFAVRIDTGDMEQAASFSYRPRPVNTGEIINGIVESSGLLKSFSRGEARRTVEQLAAIAPFRPPVETAMVGSDGTLWLKREGRRDSDRNVLEQWLVLTRNAEAVGQVILPARTRMLRPSLDKAWAVSVDTMGVNWLVRYRFEQSRGGEGSR
jgi:hypothetical protein